MNSRRYPRRAKSGFSLIEIVIVLFLTGIILSCVAGLTDRTFKTLRFLQEKSKTLESATLACERLAVELKEAVAVPDLSNGVAFVKVLPSAPFGVGNDADANPDSWTRTYASQTARISYSIPGGESKVVRQVNSEIPMDVATDVNAFVVSQHETRGYYKVVLSILEDRRVITFETIVSCPGVPR